MRLQPSQDQIRIRDRRLTAAAITNRARISPSRLRPHPQGPRRIEARNGPSTRANRVDVKHRHTYGQACNLGLIASVYFAVDQCNVGRSTAHIEGYDSLASAAARHGHGPHDSSRGAGEHRPYRLASCGTQSGDSTVGLHDKNANVTATIAA